MIGGRKWDKGLNRKVIRQDRLPNRDFWIAFEKQSDASTTAGGPRKRTSTGSSGSSISTASGILPNWARRRSLHFSTTSQASGTLPRPRRIRRYLQCCFSTRKRWIRRLPWLDGLDRVKRPVCLPVVLSQAEVRALLAQLHGMKWLIASLLYGAGLRLRECLLLRVKDVDFSYRQILVREGKGSKDRITMLPEAAIQPLHVHLGKVHNLHRRDLAEGYGEVWLPDALSRKYPRAASEWGWQFVFPSKNRSVDPETGVIRRHHVYPDTLHRTVKRAAHEAGIYKPVSSHTLRHYAECRTMPSRGRYVLGSAPTRHGWQAISRAALGIGFPYLERFEERQ